LLTVFFRLFLFSNLNDKENPEKITLEEAIQLLKYPKHLGKIGRKSVVLHQGKNNFYVKVSKDSYSVNNEKYPDPDKITVDDVKDIIEEKKKNNLWEAEDENKTYVALSGPYGKYVKILSKEKKKKPFNVKIPVDFNIEELTIEKVEEFAKNKYKNRGRGKSVRGNKFNKKTKVM
jgi:DNA topoisomerase-1